MKKWQIIAVGIVLLIPIIAAIAFEDSLKIEDTSQTLTERIYTPEELLAEANKLRAEKGVSPLKLDERLNESAQWKANDMKEFNYFGHVKPDETRKDVGTGEPLAYGAARVYDIKREDGKSVCLMASENLQINHDWQNPYTNDGWSSSKPHYEAIVDEKYDSTGFGIAKDGNKLLYVQHFCDLR